MALAAFHEEHPTVAVELNVTRKPYSFLGQQPLDKDEMRLKRKGIWHERLMDYTGDPASRDQFERQLQQLGEPSGIIFDFGAYLNKQPIDSQRLLLWAARFGKAEAFVAALSARHFERSSEGESASKRHTLVAAAEEAGLDVIAAEKFLVV